MTILKSIEGFLVKVPYAEGQGFVLVTKQGLSKTSEKLNKPKSCFSN